MRSITTIAIVVGLLLIVLMGGCSSYNRFVDMEENVENAWSNVQSAYQRRADLVPNLVSTVKGAAEFERETLESVTAARARATSINLDADDLTPENIARFQEAQAELGQGIGRLLATVENYPQLQATAGFRELQAQLEGTENRINVERNRYNETATQYNKAVRRFPGTVFASMFGFEQKAQFEAQEGAQQAPTVEF